MSAKKNRITHEIYEDRFKNDCYSDVHYFIDDETKTIACKIQPYMCNCFNENTTPAVEIDRSFFEMCEDCNVSFIGKAVCLPDDTYDVEFGKKLAYDKAMFKMLAAKKRFFKNQIKFFTSLIGDIEKEIDKVEAIEQKVTERFENKIKEVM